MEEFGLDYVADSEKGENWLAKEWILRRRLFVQHHNLILDGDVRCKYRCDGWPYQICEVLCTFLLPGQFRLPYRPRRDQDRRWARPPAAVRMLGETGVVSPPTIPSIRLGHSRSEIWSGPLCIIPLIGGNGMVVITLLTERTSFLSTGEKST